MLSGTYSLKKGKKMHGNKHTAGPTISASKKIESKKNKNDSKFNGNAKLWTVFKNFIYDNDNRI